MLDIKPRSKKRIDRLKWQAYTGRSAAIFRESKSKRLLSPKAVASTMPNSLYKRDECTADSRKLTDGLQQSLKRRVVNQRSERRLPVNPVAHSYPFGERPSQEYHGLILVSHCSGNLSLP